MDFVKMLRPGIVAYLVVWAFAALFGIKQPEYAAALDWLKIPICFGCLLNSELAEPYLPEWAGSIALCSLLAIVGLLLPESATGAFNPQSTGQLGTTYGFGAFTALGTILCERRIRRHPRKL